MSPYTLYVNPYYVTEEFAANAVIIKHYYMGAQRVATQLAGTENLEPSEEGPGEEMMKQGEQTNNPILANLEHVLTDFGKKKGTDYTPEDLLRTAQLTDYYPDTTHPQASNYKTPSPGGQPYAPPRVVYYYHPDYLGNVEYITDADGLPYQYFFYSPWGEPLKDQTGPNYANWESPYKFNGKELDEETGLYYYGARYYNPQVSVWLGVDAMAENAHNLPLTPYHFSANNPIMIIDPDGNDWYTAIGDDPGDPIWFDNDEAAQEHFGEGGFNNIGTQAFGFNPETGNNILYGNKGNKYEFSTMIPEVEVDGGYMSDHARTMQNPMVQAVHQGQKDFVFGAGSLGVHLLDETGQALSYAGYALTLTGVGAEIGVPLAALGNGMSTTADGIRLVDQILTKDKQGAAQNIGFYIAGELLEIGIKRIPGGRLTTDILKQNGRLKMNLIQEVVEKKQTNQ